MAVNKCECIFQETMHSFRWFTFSGPSDVVACPDSASNLLLFSSTKPFGRRAVSLDEKEVTEEGEEVFSV